MDEPDFKSQQHLSDISDDEALFLNSDNSAWQKFAEDQGDWLSKLFKARDTTTTAERYKPFIVKSLKANPMTKKRYTQENVYRYIIQAEPSMTPSSNVISVQPWPGYCTNIFA